MNARIPAPRTRITRTTRSTTPHRSEAENRLIDAAGWDLTRLFVTYNAAAYDGHDAAAVEVMRARYGENTVAQTTHLSILKGIVEAFINPFTVVLFVLAAISFVTDYLAAAPADKNLTGSVVIVTLVLLSGILRFVQETRSATAAASLGKMVQTTIAVMRNSDTVELPIDQVVVGDVIKLAAGDMVPADMRVLKAKDLFVSQSSLTGEAEPVEKRAGVHVGQAGERELSTPLDADNLVFMGSNVVSGSATALVIAVGADTTFGQIAKSLGDKKPPTAFERGVNRTSWVLIRFMLVMVPVVLFLTGITKHDWMGAVLFALSVAVGMTPEMLPAIVSANLAKGAVAMARRHVIVKKLDAIQNFGGMDTLCTDKTGTLTQDRIVLEYSLNVAGHPDDRVLRHAFLNSYYQTGLKNLLDEAIIDHADDVELDGLDRGFYKVDEIPFDFNRRRMSVVVADESGKRQMITKGAIEEVLAVCSHVDIDGEIRVLDEQLDEKVLATARRYNNEGMRVLGVAQKTNPRPPAAFSAEDESDMVLIGFLAFLDPPKETTAAAVDALHQYGVDIKVLTGDNAAVARAVCREVGIGVSGMLTGNQVADMTDDQLDAVIADTDVFAKLSPAQKVRIIAALRRAGHVVGYMGDGINDAAAMKESDVGISVDTAVDVAKESADIILLEKDLMVLERGVIEGRRVYGNTIKYIKMTASSNFGNMLSVLFASAFLPFLPMLPLQILVLNLIYDISCTSLPWDSVDDDFLRRPRNWEAASIVRFMLWFGPTSSVFDIATYLLMLWVIGPAVIGSTWAAATPAAQLAFATLFHAAWFVESLWTQTLVVHNLRSVRVPFVGSRASWQVYLLTGATILGGTVLTFTPLGRLLGLTALPPVFFGVLVAISVLYMVLVTAVKRVFVRRFGDLL
ncbi:MAG: magnesium-translocating P-type ATPase [Actinomycetes bacterium]|nr:magnesium-translocating P-type ATPase [Actinomycetes bacterium]